MHTRLTRQLPARLAARLATLMTTLMTALALHARPLPAEPPAPEVAVAQLDQELLAAKLLETMVLSRSPAPADQQKIEQNYLRIETQHPGSAAVKNTFAEFLWNAGKRPEAVAKWEAAERLVPGNPQVLAHLGSAFLEMGQVRQGSEYLHRASEAAPKDPTLHFSAANALFMFRHELLMPEPQAFALATQHFRRASQLSPANAEYAQAYAEVFYSLPAPDWNLALEAWEHLRTLSQIPDFALSHLARAHLKLGQETAARECLEKMRSPEFAALRARIEAKIPPPGSHIEGRTEPIRTTPTETKTR